MNALEGSTTFYTIQHNHNEVWYDTNFDFFGYPPGFQASNECWQKIGQHGVFSKPKGINALLWISKKNPDIKFRLMKVDYSCTYTPIMVMN